MGNTIATPTSHHATRRPSHQYPHQHQQQQKASSTKSLRKMTSSSTLSSLKMYRQANRSDTSLSSKMSARSTSRTNFGEKILDISKPTKFEHGIHVEYNRDSGKYMVHLLIGIKPNILIENLGLTGCLAVKFT